MRLACRSLRLSCEPKGMSLPNQVPLAMYGYAFTTFLCLTFLSAAIATPYVTQLTSTGHMFRTLWKECTETGCRDISFACQSERSKTDAARAFYCMALIIGVPTFLLAVVGIVTPFRDRRILSSLSALTALLSLIAFSIVASLYTMRNCGSGTSASDLPGAQSGPCLPLQIVAFVLALVGAGSSLFVQTEKSTLASPPRGGSRSRSPPGRMSTNGHIITMTPGSAPARSAYRGEEDESFLRRQ